MKKLLALLAILCAVAAYAQAPPVLQQPPTAKDLESQMVEVGCKAERQAAAQTIVQQQQQITELQKQLSEARDPKPKSGVTRH